MSAIGYFLGLTDIGNFAAPPLGPWRLAHFLQTHGQHVDVWDCNISENLHLPHPEEHQGVDRAAALAEAFVDAMNTDFDLASYDWIGLSILNDVLPTVLGVVELLRKRFPGERPRLVAGNHEATVNIQDCIGRSRLDAVIMGDAEIAMLRLMQGEEPSKVPGVIWRNFNPKPSREMFEEWNAGIRWRDIPYERYWELTKKLYPFDKMTEEEKLDKLYEIHCVRIHSIVACELACQFCSVKTTRRWASGSNKPSIINLSPDALAKNLLAIKEQVPNVMTIYDSSDEAWLGKGRGEDYCAAVESVKPIMDKDLPKGLRLLVQVRTNDLTESLVDYAARVGIKHLTIGVESPVEQVRRDMMKPQKESHVRNSIRWMAERGINPYLLFIAFYPTITLEQLREAVDNWRLYMTLGATISIEPLCMSYLGTDLADSPNYLTEYAGYEIPFSGTPKKRLKWATLIWPTDRRVCAIEQWFRSNIDDYIEQARKKAGHYHTFKGFSGRVIVNAIEEGIRLYDAGKIPPWEPGVIGQRSAVFQDYGDQMSGVEIAAAAKMERRNKTTTRFNSTHSLLDDPNAGVKGRIKDPALPHEMTPAPSDTLDAEEKRRRLERISPTPRYEDE